MKQILDAVVYELEEKRREWTADGIPVLTADLSVPQCAKSQTDRVSRRLNRYYRQCARSFLTYCDRFLYPQALAEFQQACQTGAPLPHARAQFTCQVTCNREHVFSLYMDCTEWAGTPDAITLRRSDTWNLINGYPITARECFPRSTHVRKLCLETAREHCNRQEADGFAAYAANLPQRLRRHLNLRNFYLSDEGFHFFYQMYAIAPAIEGTPTFFLPFSATPGPIWPISHGLTCKTEKAIV